MAVSIPRPARAAAVLTALVALMSSAAPALASDGSVTLVPADGTRFEINGRSYAGALTITASPAGLALTEQTTIDRYLAGIKEVPFGWPEEALAAQVVAARTYLASTLGNGRTENGRRYGYDICASSACQVYAGVGYVDEPSGRRWLDAIEATSNEILTYDGRPIQAVYSSSMGARTMAVQDVWGGAAVPYLQPVDSPEEGVSPYYAWEVEVPSAAFVEILAADGHEVGGELLAMVHRRPPEGEGRATVWISTTGGTVTILANEIKGAMNRHGHDLYPTLLPDWRSDGERRLPQALPSYDYDVSYTPLWAYPEAVLRFLPPYDASHLGTVQFVGQGWGHGVGMSQYGAYAMALNGADYREIVGHYYGGLVPEDAGAHLPETVVVGLGWELGSVTFDASGPFQVISDDAGGPRSGGRWSVFVSDGRLVLWPSIGYPIDPRPGRDAVPV
jgi:stage II sporulation protein D